jgi:hypothetical protein
MSKVADALTSPYMVCVAGLVALIAIIVMPAFMPAT